MSTPLRLSGLTVNNYRFAEDPLTKNTAGQIHGSANDFTAEYASRFSVISMEQILDGFSRDARVIIDSIGPGCAVDVHNELIDKITQRDELLLLSFDLHKIQTVVRKCLQTDSYIKQFADFRVAAQPLASLTRYCDRIKSQSQQMYQKATVLNGQIHVEKAKNIADLKTATDALSADCLGIVAEYLIT